MQTERLWDMHVAAGQRRGCPLHEALRCRCYVQELEACRAECSSLVQRCRAWEDDCRRLREEHAREAAGLAARAEEETASLRQQHAEQLDAALAVAAAERARAEALLRDEMCKTLQASILGKHSSALVVCMQWAA